MNQVYYFSKSIKNEALKLKNTFALWLSIISALFIPIIYFLYYFFKHKSLVPGEGVNPWNKFIMDQIMSASPLLVPFFIILITSLIIQIEHKSSAMKYLFSLPSPKWSIYFGKLLVAVGLILFTYLLFFGAMLVSGNLVGYIHPELGLIDHTPDYQKPMLLLFRSFLAILGILGIQFLLSFRIKNFIIPLGIGMVLVITGLIVYSAEESLYFPYAYNMLSLYPIGNEEASLELWFPKVSIISIIYFVGFSVFGYWSVSRMSVK
ncbi:MAG: ABC transporter permease [Flavobacteriaceae bacterium]|nr:ABC transporter permease [Flavobacteriaceae bacterium]